MNLFVRIISSKYTKWIYFLTGLFCFLLLIPLYLSWQPFLKSFGLVLFIPFVVLAVIYFLLALIFIIFSPKLPIRWSYGLAGLTTGVGFVYLSLAPAQAFLNLMVANLKEDPGLAGLVLLAPAVGAIQGTPLIALLLGFIGYRLGKQEEIAKKMEAGQIGTVEFAKEGRASIFVDAFGVFGIGFFGIFALLAHYFLYTTRPLYERLDNEFLAFINQAFIVASLPTSGFLGFYFIRLMGHKIRSSIPNVSRKQTATVIILLIIFSFFTFGLNSIFSSVYVYKNRIANLSQKTSMANFTESLLPEPSIIGEKLEISASLFVPFEGDYEVRAELVDLSKENIGRGGKYHDELLPTHEISVSTGTQTVDQYSSLHLKQGVQEVTFSMEFSGFFEAKTPVWWRNLLKQAIDNNSVGIEINIDTTTNKGRYADEKIFETTYNISRQSLDRLGLLQLFQESK